MLPASGPLVPDVRRMAVLRANSIGDFVLVLPALEALRAAYPAAEITVLGAPWHPRLLANRPGPWDRVVVLPAWPGLSGQVPDAAFGADGLRRKAFLGDQRRQRYDLALQLHGGGRASNPLVRSLGARVTAGARDDDAPALDRTVAYARHQHEVLRWLEVAGLVGAGPVTLEPWLAVTARDREAARGLVPATGRPLVVLHPGANDPRRRWPVDSFAAVATALAGEGMDVAVVGAGADDARAATRIGARLDAAGIALVDLVDRASMSALLGVLERGALFVGNDSGPRHLAAAVGTPTVGIFWRDNLINVGPLTRRRHRVRVSFATGYDDDVSLVADVPVDDVLDDARALLRGAPL